jgi:hypothetical protein
LDDAADEEHFEAGGEEGDADGAGHEDHAAYHGLFVADPFGDVAVDDEAEDAANLSSISLLHTCKRG